MNPLVVQKISRRFGGVQALEEVSFEVSTGERRAIIGTNGAGKTTLFNVINGQLAATAGRVWLFGQDVTALPPYARAALGLSRTFQITSLFPRLTTMENMILAVQALDPARFVPYRSVRSYKHIVERAEGLLETWNLWDARHSLVCNLAYGVQRRLELVLALAGSPKLLLLDEPMSGLSAAETHLVTDIIRNLDRSVTVLLIEHDLSAAFRIADWITALHQGRVVAEGTPEEIRQESKLREIYLGVGRTSRERS